MQMNLNTILCKVIDSLDWLEPLIHAKTCEAHKQASIESFGYGRGYAEALKYFILEKFLI